ncbi:sulfur-oxidizing protein SoxY [Myxococcaceae bacterium]|nr:sulfur-oxidizing protein SoxY [Myxococcaceae bacterium]
MLSQRRRVLRWGAGALLAGVAGLAMPLRLLAAEWKKSAFTARDPKAALTELGIGNYTESREVLLKAPDIAENGAVVPIEVTSLLPNTSEILIVGEKNPVPLVARFIINPGMAPEISLRMKMAETGKVRALVKSGGNYYSSAKEVKITIGGCGG